MVRAWEMAHAMWAVCPAPLAAEKPRLSGVSQRASTWCAGVTCEGRCGAVALRGGSRPLQDKPVVSVPVNRAADALVEANLLARWCERAQP